MTSPGEVLIVGLPGLRLDRESAAILGRFRPAGVILFQRNFRSLSQARELTASLREQVPETLLFVDAEGGRVDRLREVVGPAPAGERLAKRPVSVAGRAGRWIGHALRAVDLDVDFAPVVDLDRKRQSNALDGRYLGDRPGAVTARARAFLRGLHAAGVGACLKHFPGLGGAGEDTHQEPSIVHLRRKELELDLAPFRALAASARCVMMSHAAYPALDPEGRPASLSPAVTQELLRRRLGFEGLVVSDDLDMKALLPWGDLPDRAALALESGCDAIPLCWSLQAVPDVARSLRRRRYHHLLERSARRWKAYRRHLVELRRSAPRHSVATVVKRLASLNEDEEGAWV